ncbi:hypothetical protein TPHA_0A00690 [Tetrapisispora phaffii CBS 4417]|uniref:DNA 3'-5' helicase n=1 Tax=Tetrapisispora phaffii (strain ATCC 24235 / CBS 4417 / NBRC 1672 / NRRL Y-8282 / UCD 70-5) TaxID=1071381 RepID=G8BMM6_TETPH|nr:hypothetical protein TPHA_0A00690 [Tetrapisispora phaffii CBS 4417]CCE61154.1 hypothetical protein TPHA_0A00690 [Tetrapisispora phaffii CBS 4417]
MKLTNSQEVVVQFPYQANTTLKVVAGPGSGKTTTCLNRVYHLIKNKIVDPSEILILSLTNKSVENITDKLLDTFESLERENGLNDADKVDREFQIADLVKDISVSTIHSLANRVLTEYFGTINVIDDSGWRGLQNLISTEFWSKHSIKPSSLYATKQFEKLYDDYKISSNKIKGELTEIAKIMNNNNVFTHNDLIIQASKILKEKGNEKDIADVGIENQFTYHLLNNYKIVIIDEFQDLYPSLLKFLIPICKNKQLELYGDDNQSIYEFLGSNAKVMKILEECNGKENLKLLKLQENFRSSAEIVELSKKILLDGKQISKDNILSNAPKSYASIEPIVEYTDNILQELEYIVSEICKLVSCGAKLSDLIIMTRTNAKLDIINNFLSLYGIETKCLSSNPDWIKNSAIQCLLDITKLVYSLTEDSSMDEVEEYSILKSDFSTIIMLNHVKGIGKISIKNLFEGAQKNNCSLWHYISQGSSESLPVNNTTKNKIIEFVKLFNPIIEEKVLNNLNSAHELLENITNIAYKLNTGIFEFENDQQKELFKENLYEFSRVLKNCAATKDDDMSLLKWFLQSYRDQTIVTHERYPTLRSKENMVNLSTIHCAKGLEYPIAFVVGDLQTHKLPIDKNTLYVAATRARNLLYMINIRHYNIKATATTNPILTNSSFWKFYNKDVSRRYQPGAYTEKYRTIQQKYGFNSQQIRNFSINALKATRRTLRVLSR